MKKLIDFFAANPKKLFLADSLGALLTAFFLFAIMRPYNEYFGMPENVLTFLSAIAISLSAYSVICFLFLKGRPTAFIRLIGLANLSYCAITMWLMVKYSPLLTTFAIIYFISETGIICTLSYLELRVAARTKKNQS
jgi:hypothetical protein